MINQKKADYDYIITGSGCAGLSLLYRILKDPFLYKKQILVIDKSDKNTNDRTWCYWEKGTGLFEEIVTHQWKTLEFHTSDFSKQLDLRQYSYKMITGIDFYNFVLKFAEEFKNVTFKKGTITEIKEENEHTVVSTQDSKYYAEYVFNSTSIFNPIINEQNSLLQHFEGWVIKTDEPTFDPTIGTLMDFRLDQKHGATFMYVLPTSTTEALIEYTLFSTKVLDKQEYKIALEDYIKNDLRITKYEVSHTEFGIIPMSTAKFSRRPNDSKRIINIGTAGGFTKASSGYTFQFIQKHTDLIVNNLQKEVFEIPTLTFREKVYQWYDRTLIEVIISQRMEGKEIFSKMFKKLPPEQILAFLGNESSYIEDLAIMSKLPIKPFLISGLKQL